MSYKIFDLLRQTKYFIMSFLLHFICLFFLYTQKNDTKIKITSTKFITINLQCNSFQDNIQLLENSKQNLQIHEKTTAHLQKYCNQIQKENNEIIKTKNVTKKNDQIKNAIVENLKMKKEKLKKIQEQKEEGNKLNLQKKNEIAKSESKNDTTKIMKNDVQNKLEKNLNDNEGKNQTILQQKANQKTNDENYKDPLIIVASNIQAKIMQYWFPPEEFTQREDICIEIELLLDQFGNIVSYNVINPKNTREYKIVETSVIRTLNDKRISPLPLNGTKIRKILIKFCPKDAN